MIIEKATTILLIINIVLLVAGITNNEFNKMAFKNFDEVREGHLGMYYTGKDYYCVYVGDLKNYTIEPIDTHEMCHHLVYIQEEHICDEVFLFGW